MGADRVNKLRTAWTRVVTADDYERHMANIGQAQACAVLTLWALEAVGAGARAVIAGAGPGQLLEFADPELLRPYRLAFTDLNPAYLKRLSARLMAAGLTATMFADDIERSAITPGSIDLLWATLVFEHIDWRNGVETFAGLRPRVCGVAIQENPPGMTSAVTPGRVVPPSLAEAMRFAHPQLIERAELIDAFAQRGYALMRVREAEVADAKRITGLLFERVY